MKNSDIRIAIKEKGLTLEEVAAVLPYRGRVSTKQGSTGISRRALFSRLDRDLSEEERQEIFAGIEKAHSIKYASK